MRLSVVTASRGRHALLERKALALARQTLAPATFEWCVYLNEDADAVGALTRRLEALALPFRVVVDGGAVLPVGAARNRAAAAASGRVLLLSDDDCLPDPEALEAHVVAHEGRGDLVGIGPLRLPEALRVEGRREPFERRATLLGGRALWINLTGANASLGAELYARVGGYDDDWQGYGGEDPELALRLRDLGARFRHVPRGGATHEGRVADDPVKAYAAGAAHVRVVRRHPRHGSAWWLGVHPLLLGLKRALLSSRFGRALDPDTRAYERAYADGATDAWARVRGGADAVSAPGGAAPPRGRR